MLSITRYMLLTVAFATSGCTTLTIRNSDGEVKEVPAPWTLKLKEIQQKLASR